MFLQTGLMYEHASSKGTSQVISHCHAFYEEKSGGFHPVTFVVSFMTVDQHLQVGQ